MLNLNLSQLENQKPVKVNLDGVDVCVVKVGSEVFAIGDTCSHSDASLSEGEVSGSKIECWLHGAEFDLRTGQALTPPAVEAVATYKVEIKDDVVTIGGEA